MMKKILFTLTILLFATGSSMAQEITNPELKKFVAELRTPGNGPRNVSKDEEKGIYAINSVDEESYKALSAIIENYDIYFAEEIFGMELMLNLREGGSQTIVFQGDTYGLAITDNAHSLDLSVTIVKGSAVKLFFEIDDTSIKEEDSTEVYFNYNDGDVYLSESSIRVEEPRSGNVASMTLLQEWISNTDARKADGVKTITIAATDIAAFAATKKKQQQTDWSLQGYSDAMKAVFAEEVPGGEPTYIYRRSTTTEGYETMKSDLQQFFYLDGKDKSHRYKGFKAIERIDTDEYSFLHLYDGNSTILIYDSHAEKYCQMDIIVGGAELFNDAVNDISIDHNNGHATKCNIIIRDGDIEFTNEEVEINGVTYDCGVHFTTGYMNKLK